MQPLPHHFTVFDVETTGLSAASGDRIIEIAGVRIENGMIQEQASFVSLVNPCCDISWEAMSINHISNEAVSSAPTIENVLPRFLSFAEGSFLIAHNAQFDLSFLNAEKEMCWGYIDIPECFCTMQLSRKVFPHEFRHNLDIVAQRLGFDSTPSRHRALPDVLLTAKVFLALLEKGKLSSLDELRRKAGMKVLA
ncbi:MAG TPA: 3'-5' exonuclease [Candidatus Peribacterales bacterium]|nr:3'-5' exonuclease [Candidatus Peribacterales bacterium]